LTLDKWLYSLSNPVNYTDPSGHTVCLYGYNPEAKACNPGPFNALLPPWLATVATQSSGTPQSAIVGGVIIVGSICAYVIGEAVKAVAQSQTKPVTWVDVNPQPNPKPTVVIVPLPTPSREPKHEFYFNDVGPYTPRDTSQIISDLQSYGIEGMAQSITQLKTAQEQYDKGNTWMIDILTGRKFEAERAIFFAGRNALVEMDVFAEHYDLIVRNFRGISFVEVKWSRGPMPATTIADVVASARQHPSGTYLVESNNIDETARKALAKEGGIQLPYPYP